MIDFLLLLGCALTELFRSRARLEAKFWYFASRSTCLRRKSPKRPAFSNIDRRLLVWLSRLVPTTLEALTVVRPETVIRWHYSGFRAYWRFKSRPRGGRPKMPLDIRQLVRDMSVANPLWGAPRIHGELLKLRIEVGQTTREECLVPLVRAGDPDVPPLIWPLRTFSLSPTPEATIYQEH